MTATFNNADGRPVVAADTAETIGEVKGFVVDQSATRVDLIHVSGRGRNADVIAWSSIRSFGADAVMVEAADATGDVAGGRDTDAVKGKVVARETRVLDLNGFERGTVDDVMFDSETGEITGVLTTEGHLAAADLRSLGSYALVIEVQ